MNDLKPDIWELVGYCIGKGLLVVGVALLVGLLVGICLTVSHVGLWLSFAYARWWGWT